MPAGRPKKTLAQLPDGWKEAMLAIAREGGSELECRVELGMSNDLWYRLKDEEPEFSEVVKSCKELCQVWWERHGRKMASGQADGNPTTWIFNMKNRFGWADKQEVEQHNTHRFAVSDEPEGTDEWLSSNKPT